MYDFDKVVDRRGTSSIKWNSQYDFGQKDGLLPYWIADTDFAAEPKILEAMKKRLDHPCIGYADPWDSVYDAVQGWWDRRHGWKPDTKWMLFGCGVMTMMIFNIRIAMAIASAFTYGIYLVGNEKGPVNELPIEVKMFYISLPGAAAFSVIAPATGSFVVPDNITTWVMAIGGSGLFTVGGYFLMIYGIGKLGASTAAFVSMVEPIVSTVFGTLWFRDPVTVGIVAGSCLVVGSILLIAIDGYQKSKRGTQSKAGQTA